MKAILVDDEPLVLIGMQSMISWPDLGIELAGTARNGADAWNLIASQQPDLVICDIMMPVMNGLALLEKCRNELGALPLFIMLTGYEDFSYIQQCLKLGVTDYLVKVDFTPDDLKKALAKAKEQLRKEQKLRTPETNAPASGLVQYRDRLLIRLFNGNYDTLDVFQQNCGLYGLTFDAPSYTIAYAEIERKDLPTEQKATLTACIANMAADILPKYLPASLVAGIDLQHFAALIPRDTAGRECTDLLPILRNTGDILYQYFNAGIRWAVGFPVENILEVKKSLRIAMSLLTQMPPQESACCYHSEASPMNYRAQTVSKIQDYIRQNLSSHLTLNDVAKVFGFSPNYLSQLLSSSGEASFVEFVTQTRIDTAKELMATTDMKIYEISDQLGFETSSYFSKVFKRIEGITPREYMQMLGK